MQITEAIEFLKSLGYYIQSPVNCLVCNEVILHTQKRANLPGCLVTHNSCLSDDNAYKHKEEIK